MLRLDFLNFSDDLRLIVAQFNIKLNLTFFFSRYIEPTTAIDAYEMNDYHKFNYNYKNKQQDERVIFKRTGATGNSPPPQYF